MTQKIENWKDLLRCSVVKNPDIYYAVAPFENENAPGFNVLKTCKIEVQAQNVQNFCLRRWFFLTVKSVVRLTLPNNSSTARACPPRPLHGGYEAT